jgi:hypothetical protein
MSSTTSQNKTSRRSFLKSSLAASAAAAAAVGGGLGNIGSAFAQQTSPNRFGRMFPRLAPFASSTPQMRAALMDIAKLGGIMDAKDDLSKGPVLLITDLSLSANNPNNPTHTAGTTFFGQFLDHDMTFDQTSKLGVPVDPKRSPNARNPTLELDTVYGLGPRGSPLLYDPADRAKLRIESGGRFEDLPRDPLTKAAIIAEPRNDENMMLSGLQAAFIKFHNRAVDYVRAQGGAGRRDPDEDGDDDDRNTVEGVFRRARRLTVWHYQWMIVNEFLPLFIGQPLTDDIFNNGGRFFRPEEGEGFIPVEFATAAYRFGHSMVRPSYRANLKGNPGDTPFFGMVFAPGDSQVNAADPTDLAGGKRAPRRFIGWQTFFKFPGAFATDVRPNKIIDTRLSTPLFTLPTPTIFGFESGQPTSLPQRNLLRHLTFGLPSGQAIAQAMGAPMLSAGDLSDLQGYNVGLDTSTPLFYYILREAHVMKQGLTLGPVGGRIVGEVFAGMLKSDDESYLSVNRNWRPTLPTLTGAVDGTFRMIDFLTFAQVDPTSRNGA